MFEVILGSLSWAPDPNTAHASYEKSKGQFSIVWTKGRSWEHAQLSPVGAKSRKNQPSQAVLWTRVGNGDRQGLTTERKPNKRKQAHSERLGSARPALAHRTEEGVHLMREKEVPSTVHW